MKKHFLFYIATFIVMSFAIQACDEDNKTSESLVDSYDRETMIANYSDSYIIPAYEAYEQATADLHTAASAFATTPDATTLSALRTEWKDALLIWQDVAFLEFGPAAQISLRSQTNLYPADADQIDSNIENGGYNLGSASNLDAKGFQAIDYLLWGTGEADDDVIAYFTDKAQASTYLTEITEELKSNAATVRTAWTGGYSTQFKRNVADNAVGSSVNDLVNAINLHYEAYLRKGKIGLSAGVFNGFSEAPMPDHVEAYYNGESLPYVYRSVEAMQKFINGATYVSAENREGFDDYLQYVNATMNGAPLHELINTQFAEVKKALDAINDPLSNEVTSNSTGVKKVYEEMQKLVPKLKVEKTNALETTITYQDNDGD